MARVENGHAPVERSALLQERTKQFAAFYEENAYRAYNLALRITCEHDRAMRATERAFLGVATSESASAEICNAVVATALAEAKDTPSDVSGAGGPEAEALLEATAMLSPPERASLALAGLEEAKGAEIAAALGLAEPAADQLLEKALKGFAGELGADDGRERLETWLWAEPPLEVWEELFPRFHKAEQRRLDNEGTHLTKTKSNGAGPARKASSKNGSGKRGSKSRLALLRRVPVWLAVVVLVLLGLGGVAASKYLGGGDHKALDARNGPNALPPSAGGPLPGEKGAKKLDDLRQRELRDLMRKRKQELAARDAKSRAAHAKKSSSKRRSKKAKRKGATVPSLAPSGPSYRPAKTSPSPLSTTAPKTGTQPKNSGSGDKKQSGSNNTGSPDQNCLFNPDQSMYICPQDQSQPTK
jgi:hypothetical protein